ncbi:GNAT family N-acetyltransferase [Chloroflexota bacterium]
MDADITVRPVETQEEFRACHAVQRAAWSFPDLMIVPYTQLVTLQLQGGLVLGAYDGHDLVGFVYGFLGRRVRGPIHLFSQRLAVVPAYRGRGIGAKLKWAQRTWALEQELTRIVWTYDPLQAVNANLNVTKLGGVVRHYRRDVFGSQIAETGSDLATDRFLLEWDLLAERVFARLSPDWLPPSGRELQAGAEAPVNTVTWDEQGLPICGQPDIERDGGSLLVEVPADWPRILKADAGLARDWRTKTRHLFEGYLARGYVVTGYAADRGANRRSCFYLMENAE